MSANTPYKAQAERLAAHFSSVHKFRLKHAASLEAIAAVHGARDWNTLCARPHEPALAATEDGGSVSGPDAAKGALSRLYPTHSFSDARFCDDLLRLSVHLSGKPSGERDAVIDHLLHRQVKSGGGFLYIHAEDDKGRRLGWLSAAMRNCGRDDSLLALTPGSNDVYRAIDLLGSSDADELAHIVVSLLPHTEANPGADFYRQQANYILTVLFGALHAVGQRADFGRLAAILCHPEQELLALEQQLSGDSLEALSYRAMLDSFRTRPGRVDSEKFKAAMGGISGRVAALTGHGQRSTSAGGSKPLSWVDALNDSKGIYVSAPTGRMVLSSLLAAAAALRVGYAGHRFAVFVDGEGAPRHLPKGIGKLLDELGVGVVVASPEPLDGMQCGLEASVAAPGGFGRPATIRLTNEAGATLDAELREFRE